MLIDNECGSFNENERSTLSTEIYELNRGSFNNNSIDNNSDNNLIATTRNSSRVSNDLYDNTRTMKKKISFMIKVIWADFMVLFSMVKELKARGPIRGNIKISIIF